MVTVNVTDDVTQIQLSEADTSHRADSTNPHSVTAAQVGSPTTAAFNDHSARHENGGADEISVAGLSGELADAQPVKAHDLAGADHNAATLAQLNAKVSDATLDDSGDPRDPNAHALGGAAHSADTLANLNSKVSDATLDDSSASRTPTAHDLAGALHNSATLAEINAKISDDTLAGLGTAQTWSANQSLGDSVKHIYGDGGDAEVYYDGTNLVIRPQAVGSGGVMVDANAAAADAFILYRNNATRWAVGLDGTNSHAYKFEAATSFGTGVFGFATPSIPLELDDGIVRAWAVQRAVESGITASTTQTQGQGPLTADINEVSTVGTTNDTVTLPTAVAGRRVSVINNGANTLQIFPASGDNLGAGVDTATTLASGGRAEFESYDATNWKEL